MKPINADVCEPINHVTAEGIGISIFTVENVIVLLLFRAYQSSYWNLSDPSNVFALISLLTHFLGGQWNSEHAVVGASC